MREMIGMIGFFLFSFYFVIDGHVFTSASKKEVYDIMSLVSELGLQFCTIVEIGQGICSLFLEIRDSADDNELKHGTVAEVFLGECQCSTLREWSFCHPQLAEARGETCRFKEGTGRDPTSQRVHRRLCDFYHMINTNNKPCDCHRRLSDCPFIPVTGFGTCFRSPLPDSLCGRHSVCGVAACHGATTEGFALVHCDPMCKGSQPFCEDTIERAPLVTSYWSEWTTPEAFGFASAKVSLASCLAANSRAPAFDCLGPGLFCCTSEENCFCDVEYTLTGKNVRRFTDIDMHINLAKLAGRTTDRYLWNRMLARVAPFEKYRIIEAVQNRDLNNITSMTKDKFDP